VADAGFRTLFWLTTGQTRREWVAVHRKHHTFTDREGDPHSPRLLGLWRVQVWNGIWPGLVTGLMHAVLYVFVLAPLINGLGHWRGAQNFANTAYNSRVLAWARGSESLHNNHHAHPRAPKFSMRRFEFDPSWVVIRCLAAVRLVEIVGAPVRPSSFP
jgi:stearoyl-CoA desaturase (delta-9 desaturase)